MKTLEDQLVAYGARQRELHGPIPVSELRSGAPVVSVASGSTRRMLPRWLPGLAAAAAIVVGLGLVILYTGDTSPSGTGTTLGEPSPAAGVTGLPPQGALPSDPTPGEVVLHLEGNISGGLELIWIYADGRVISQRPLSVPEGVGREFSGLTERRLTPEGVESLLSQVVASGLFDEDLMLAREGDAPFLRIEALSGGRLVKVTWAWRGIAGNAPVATPEQETALLGVNALLTRPGSWPDEAWQDPTVTAYVPSQYAICFGVTVLNGEPGQWTGPIDPELVWAVLPESARDLVRAGEATEGRWMHQDGGCSQMSTDDARSLALILRESGIEPLVTSGIFVPETYVLGFVLSDQAIPAGGGVIGEDVFIQFAPFLPHGEAVWWGPG